MFRIAVLVSGGGTNLQALIDNIENGTLVGVSICVVVSSNPDAYALERCRTHGIKAVTVSKADFADTEAYETRMLEILREEKTELVVLAGYMTVLSKKFINSYENRIINVHPSLIPSFCGAGYYGLKPHEEALKKGVKVAGATVHFVNEEPDAGPIILQKAVEVMDGDTPQTLQKRVMEQAEWHILSEAVSLISRGELAVEGGIVRRVKR